MIRQWIAEGAVWPEGAIAPASAGPDESPPSSSYTQRIAAA